MEIITALLTAALGGLIGTDEQRVKIVAVRQEDARWSAISLAIIKFHRLPI